MRYVNHYHNKWLKIAVVFFMILCFLLLGGGFFFLTLALSNLNPSITVNSLLFRLSIVLLVMGIYISICVYMWCHIVSEISLENNSVTFTYLNNKKETINVNDVIQVKIYTSCYRIKTKKKEYSVAVKFNFASMKHESIEFIKQEYFPNAKFINGLFWFENNYYEPVTLFRMIIFLQQGGILFEKVCVS